MVGQYTDDHHSFVQNSLYQRHDHELPATVTAYEGEWQSSADPRHATSKINGRSSAKTAIVGEIKEDVLVGQDYTETGLQGSDAPATLDGSRKADTGPSCAASRASWYGKRQSNIRIIGSSKYNRCHSSHLRTEIHHSQETGCSTAEGKAPSHTASFKRREYGRESAVRG